MTWGSTHCKPGQNFGPGAAVAQSPFLPCVPVFVPAGPQPWGCGGVAPGAGRNLGLSPRAGTRGWYPGLSPGAVTGVSPRWQRGQCLRAPAPSVGRDIRRSSPSGPPYSSAVAMALQRCCQAGGGGLCVSPLGSLEGGRCPRWRKPRSLLSITRGERGFSWQNTPNIHPSRVSLCSSELLSAR